MTEAEKIMWDLLRNPACRFKFRRQHPIGPYITDFYCPELKLVIEADGGQHGDLHDEKRDTFLKQEGLRILRFWNNDILNNRDGVWIRIDETMNDLKQLPRVTPTLALPPQGGGDKGVRPPRPKKINMNGWINLDKPAGITSTDALNQVKRALNVMKAGHGGTLDPLATGILPIALGEATKILPYVTDSLKEYEFTLTWGQARDTDDAQGQVIATSDVRPDATKITAALPAFVGEISQLPPKFSALKINGERAYDLARAGTEFTLEPRPVFIESLTLISTTPDTATLHCRCGKGTYVRSIARDLGEKLGTYAYISALRRTCVGALTEKTAISLDKLLETVASSGPQTVVLPLGAALDDIPALQLTQMEAARIKQGNAIELLTRADVDRLVAAGLPPQQTDDALAVGFYDGAAIALLSVTGPHVQPVRVFNP